jgi:nanoRNase/pAp phosphatase (c-di-AMP/oligoRNAs hydrolase)
MESSFDALTRALEPLGRVVVTTHVVPDGDAIGSALALWIGLSRLGIEEARDLIVGLARQAVEASS